MCAKNCAKRVCSIFLVLREKRGGVSATTTMAMESNGGIVSAIERIKENGMKDVRMRPAVRDE
jgi:hypothetical protein